MDEFSNLLEVVDHTQVITAVTVSVCNYKWSYIEMKHPRTSGSS